MIKKLYYPLMAFSILLTACSSGDFSINQGSISSQAGDTTPGISNVETNFPKKDSWYIVPKNSGELDVSVNATNVETILFLAVPTGTEAWGERELVGYDINGEDGWNLTWNISGMSLIIELPSKH
ncbi:hypothetical protein [Paenibacillus sp. FSL R10-2771]|uniref:hypothetical protein n=1 Tax=Paenibacillus sp. FSL R10-2771 TaxID=2954693 RepID=UPI0030FA7FEB